MKVMVVGGGGREHAIIKGLAKSPKVDVIYALPGNGGIAADATCVDIGAKDLDGIRDFAVKEGIDYAVVAPDDPLAMGWSGQEGSRHRGEQSLLKGSDEEVRHPDGGL